jgi:glucokinase
MARGRLIGVDLGGTNIKAVATDELGTVIASGSRPTRRQRGQEAVLATACSLVRSVVRLAGWNVRFDALGVGVCGLISTERGTLLASPILPDWSDVPIGPLLSDRLGVPAAVNNDANAAVYAEWMLGAAKGSRVAVGLTLGTGIGGGAVINGRLYRGAAGLAAEFGHISVVRGGPRCYCGNRGCLGRTASATTLVDECLKLLERGVQTSLRLLYDKRGRQGITASAIGRAARRGDELAVKLVGDTARRIADVVLVLVDCFNPDCVVLSGGMARLGTLLLGPIREVIAARTFPSLAEGTSTVIGSLGARAGAIGAALLSLEQ